MSRVLITGGAGFIGSNLANELTSLGHYVRVIDILATQIHGNPEKDSYLFKSLNRSVDFVHADICSMNELSKLLEGIDTVVHLASETGTGQSMYEISRYSKTNVVGTAILLESILHSRNNVKKIITASTRAVYGEGKYNCAIHGISYPAKRKTEDMEKGNWELKCLVCGNNLELIPTDENSTLKPQSIYGITKLAQEQMILAFANNYGLSATALRLQNVYGPGQSLSNPYTGILSVFSTRALNNSRISVFEDGLESRDFIYIQDVVEAFRLIVEHETKEKEVYNLGSGKSSTVLSVAETIVKHINPKATIEVTGQYRAGDIRHNVADISKFKNEFGFFPKVPIDKGLELFSSWVKTQTPKTDLYEDSISRLFKHGLIN